MSSEHELPGTKARESADATREVLEAAFAASLTDSLERNVNRCSPLIIHAVRTDARRP